MNAILPLIPLLGILLVASYLLSTLALWFSHWLGHVGWSPLRLHHLLGHHRIYPRSGRRRTEDFVCSRGRHDSVRTMLPWVVALAGSGFLWLPQSWAVCWGIQVAFWTALFTWLHVQFHREHSVLGRFEWFQQARRRHDRHHDEDCNYMVGDPSWDHWLGTFREGEAGEPGPVSGPEIRREARGHHAIPSRRWGGAAVVHGVDSAQACGGVEGT